MKHRTSIVAVVSALFCGACVVACSAEVPAPGEDAPLGLDFEVLEGNETPRRDPNAAPAVITDQTEIASFGEADRAACRVVLNWCDTPGLIPHPSATCRSTNCGCARAKQICASLVQQNCGRVVAYGNDCR